MIDQSDPNNEVLLQDSLDPLDPQILDSGAKETITLTIKELNALISSYMPFLKNGGIFIPTTKKFSIGHLVNLNIQLIDLQEKITVGGSVAWITPKGAQNNRTAGIGLEFVGPNATVTRTKLDSYLANLLQTHYSSYTM